jgi:hypothetical protein
MHREITDKSDSGGNSAQDIAGGWRGNKINNR